MDSAVESSALVRVRRRRMRGLPANAVRALSAREVCAPTHSGALVQERMEQVRCWGWRRR